MPLWICPCYSAGLDTPSWIDGIKKTFEEGHRIRHLDLCLDTPACWEVLKWPSIGSKHPEFSRLEHAEICVLWHPNRESPYPGREEPTLSSDVGCLLEEIRRNKFLGIAFSSVSVSQLSFYFPSRYNCTTKKYAMDTLEN